MNGLLPTINPNETILAVSALLRDSGLLIVVNDCNRVRDTITAFDLLHHIKSEVVQ